MESRGCSKRFAPVAPPRRGFTLIELLVCLSIVALLFSLLFVAVQQSRASARRISCVNNLKEIGIAMHTHHETHGVFPPTGDGLFEDDLYKILGYPVSEPSNANYGFNLPTHIVPIFDCPEFAGYAPNDGTRYPLSREYANGIHLIDPGRKSSEIIDGLSHTAAVSERAPRDQWWIAHDIPREAGREQELIDACRHHRVSTRPKLNSTNLKGYDHFLTPNQPRCWDSAYPNDGVQHRGIMPATSNHSGGVNLLFLDGHVAFISDSIDWNVWQAIGTINGAERSAPY